MTGVLFEHEAVGCRVKDDCDPIDDQVGSGPDDECVCPHGGRDRADHKPEVSLSLPGSDCTFSRRTSFRKGHIKIGSRVDQWTNTLAENVGDRSTREWPIPAGNNNQKLDDRLRMYLMGHLQATSRSTPRANIQQAPLITPNKVGMLRRKHVNWLDSNCPNMWVMKMNWPKLWNPSPRQFIVIR